VKGKDVVKTLKQHGWQVARVKGSHFMMEKDGLVIPVPCHNWDMGIGLLKEISKKTGVKLP
jgi:predicted RNA binding protein YcfA (HicA-like mRNA interferase family)